MAQGGHREAQGGTGRHREAQGGTGKRREAQEGARRHGEAQEGARRAPVPRRNLRIDSPLPTDPTLDIKIRIRDRCTLMGAGNCPKTARLVRSGECLELMSGSLSGRGGWAAWFEDGEDSCRHRMFLPNESNADLMLMAMSFYSATQNEQIRRVILNHLCLCRGTSVVSSGW